MTPKYINLKLITTFKNYSNSKWNEDIKKIFFLNPKKKNLKVDYLFTYNKHISDIYKIYC